MRDVTVLTARFNWRSFSLLALCTEEVQLNSDNSRSFHNPVKMKRLHLMRVSVWTCLLLLMLNVAFVAFCCGRHFRLLPVISQAGPPSTCGGAGGIAPPLVGGRLIHTHSCHIGFI